MQRRLKQTSSAMRGIFTQSRSEIFLHRTLSGNARRDPSLRRHLVASIPRPSPPLPASTATTGDAILTSVKDLRTRRVFSPASIPTEISPVPTDENKPDDDRTDGMDRSEKEVTEEERKGEVDEPSKGSGGSDDDVVQSTPPPDGIDALGVNTASGDRGMEVSPNDQQADNLRADIGSGDRATGISPNGPEADVSSPPKRKQGLAPCSRSKLYRNPSSFSYRRLLPFLMDLEKDNPSGAKILSCQNNAVQVEKVIEEKPVPPACVETSPQKQLRFGCSEVSMTEESSEGWNFVENPVNGSPLPSGDDDYGAITMISPLPVACNGRAMQVDEIKSETSFEYPILESEMLHKSYLSSPIIREDLSVEELAGNAQALSCLPAKVDVDCRLMLPVPDMDQKPLQRESQQETVHSAVRHALAPKRGIIKRYGRGCKGICMCLDCATFRIHAVRAYEFSRKQMEEADEIIMGLMKELANLRNIVDKSQGGSSTILRLNQELVKGACQRASSAEEEANSRRRKLFNDLNIHCKIPGPKVTFAECVEERIVP